MLISKSNTTYSLANFCTYGVTHHLEAASSSAASAPHHPRDSRCSSKPGGIHRPPACDSAGSGFSVPFPPICCTNKRPYRIHQPARESRPQYCSREGGRVMNDSKPTHVSITKGIHALLTVRNQVECSFPTSIFPSFSSPRQEPSNANATRYAAAELAIDKVKHVVNACAMLI